MRVGQIAKRLNLRPGHVSRVLNLKLWTHLT
jgi:hypothetical protein